MEKKKLSLEKEIVEDLTSEDLNQVQGGKCEDSPIGKWTDFQTDNCRCIKQEQWTVPADWCQGQERKK